MCLSASPSNARIIKTAAKMASAFGGSFTALYVQTPGSENADAENRERLKSNIRLAEQLGADISTVYGDDVSLQIAEFARVSGVTKIVIGRSGVKKNRLFSKPTLVEKLTEIAPDIEIHIIPDSSLNLKYKEKSRSFLRDMIPRPKDLLVTVLILLAATLIGIAFHSFGFTESNIISVYILGVLLTALFTKGFACGLIDSVLSVVLFNFFFTEPRLTFHAYDPGYVATFAIMLSVSVIIGTLASKLKDHAKLSAQAAFKAKVLFDTNQLLQKAGSDGEITDVTASQLMKLLDRSVVIYTEKDGKLSKSAFFPASDERAGDDLFGEKELAAAECAFNGKQCAGATSEHFGDAKFLYMPIRINNRVYGAAGIRTDDAALDSFEKSLSLSILGECALSIDNNRNASEKERAALLAKNEQLRADLLRTISHDLRTPLTSISGNASNLLSNYGVLDEETRTQIFTDIYDDSHWLISLVENILSVTRIEEGRLNLNIDVQLMDEVIEEAMRHLDRGASEHNIRVECKDDLLLARMDAKLIIQVVINLVDNAIKYTPAGSNITVGAEKTDGFVRVCVSDDGDGIPDAIKPHVFDMFYTGDNKIADNRRSLGLGLALCKAIVTAHGGKLTLSDNVPKGSVFTFTIPSGEVKINE